MERYRGVRTTLQPRIEAIKRIRVKPASVRLCKGLRIRICRTQHAKRVEALAAMFVAAVADEKARIRKMLRCATSPFSALNMLVLSANCWKPIQLNNCPALLNALGYLSAVMSIGLPISVGTCERLCTCVSNSHKFGAIT